MILSLKDYRLLDKPWLEAFHINNYVKRYDARTEGRYLNPPLFDKLSVGDPVIVNPKGRYRLWMSSFDLWGKHGTVLEVEPGSHPQYGRVCTVELIGGKKIKLREVAFMKKSP